MKKSIKILMLTLLLLAMVLFIKTNSMEKRVTTISINSTYSKRIRLAKEIIADEKDLILIDQSIKVNPVVYELRLFDNSYNHEKTKRYFIKNQLRKEFINTASGKVGILIDKDEIKEYEKLYYKNIKNCAKERIALFNGYESFENYVASDIYFDDLVYNFRYDKLSKIDIHEYDVFKDIRVENGVEDFDKLLEKEVDEMYKKYKNKNRY